MNKTFFKKMSGILAAMMIIAMLTPVIALGSGLAGLKLDTDGKSVTGQVYFDGDVGKDVYGTGKPVSLDVYYDGKKVSALSATYATYLNDKYYYNVSKVLDSTYSWIELRYQDTVLGSVYRADTPGGPGGSGGGGGISTDIIDSNGKADATKLADLLKSNVNAQLKIVSDFVLLPASALLNGETLKVYNDDASFTLPLKALKLEELAKSMGVELKDLWIRVELKKVTGDGLVALQDAAKAQGKTLRSNAINFKLSAEANGQTTAITSFGTSYAQRTITLSDGTTITPATTTGALYDESNKSFSFVPSTFDAKEVTMQSTGASIYVAVESSVSFTDIANHWGKSYIQLLASKLVVDGYEDGTFGPERNVTRAEFAALLTRALGLKAAVSDTTYFTDVTAGQWYAGIVSAAAQTGIVDGYEDGTFRPNAPIAREELAAMVVRALDFAGKEVTVSAGEVQSYLAKFTDAGAIVWGQKELAAAVKSGLVDGVTDTTLVPRANATRAQASALLARFLGNAGFIN